MNRRDFFRTSIALAAAPLVAHIPFADAAKSSETGFISIDAVRRARDSLEKNFGARGSYVVFVHPDAERDLRDQLARERWKDAYRRERIAQKNMVRLAGNEIGRIDNVRFIVSRSVA